MKRLLIYFFYDKSGIVDNYVYEVLKSMKPFVENILFVSNGEIESKYIDKLGQYTSHVLCRKNEGFDVWAYKEALEYTGWDNLANYDEVIFMNYTIMGPLFPLDNMFNKMESQDIDFWGLSVYHKTDYDHMGMIKYGYIPLHIQSHFIVVRKSLFSADIFQKYWKNMPMINNYFESVAKHEAIFTKHFEDLGYKWSVYVDTRDMEDYVYYPMLHAPVKTIKEYKCPFFKRRSFFHNYNDYLEYSSGNQPVELLNYLIKETDYNTDYIWENLIRTCSMIDLYENIHLNYISNSNTGEYKNPLKKAVFLFIEQEKYIDILLPYLLKIDKDIDILMFVKNGVDTSKPNFEYKLIKSYDDLWDNGINPYMEYINQYDLVCTINNNLLEAHEKSIYDEQYFNYIYSNLLCNISYIEKAFIDNKFLGLLLSNNVYFGKNYYSIVNNVGKNYYNEFAKLSKEYSLEQMAYTTGKGFFLYHGMGWLRVKSLSSNNILSDNDGIKYLSLLIQNNGYYTGRVLNEKNASLELYNMQYMLKNITRFFTYDDYPKTYNETTWFIETNYIQREDTFREILFKLKNKGKRKIKRILKKLTGRK